MASCETRISSTLRLAVGAVLVVALAFVPVAVPWMQVILTLALAKGLAVLGIVILLQAGQVSFGHALFFAAGAYCAAFLGEALAGGELVLLIVAGVAVSLLVGLVVGAFVVGYRYIFFAMLNLAFSMIVFSVLEKFYHITGGSDGLQVARPLVLGIEMERAEFEVVLFYGTLATVVVIAFMVSRFLASPRGQMLRAMKSNETRLEYLGVSARQTLLTGYVLSAGLAGLGGVLTAVTQGIVTPEYAWWVRSGEFVFIAILGGAHSVAGAFVGATVYEFVRTYASAFAADIWQMVLGVFLLAIILFTPGGLVGIFDNMIRGRRQRAPASEEAAAGAGAAKGAAE